MDRNNTGGIYTGSVSKLPDLRIIRNRKRDTVLLKRCNPKRTQQGSEISLETWVSISVLKEGYLYKVK